MSVLTFTPSTRVSADSNPRDWAYELGCLPQDASILFTKQSLISFLKTHGIEVGPNYTEINKVPRYASIGTTKEIAISGSEESCGTGTAAEAAKADTVAQPVLIENDENDAAGTVDDVGRAEIATAAKAPNSTLPSSLAHPTKALQGREPDLTSKGQFRPSRRVREPVGGGSAQISALFGGSPEDERRHEEVLLEASRENARRRGQLSDTQPKQPNHLPVPQKQEKEQLEPSSPMPDEENVAAHVFRPSRRVREPGGTGGTSSITLG